MIAYLASLHFLVHVVGGLLLGTLLLFFLSVVLAYSARDPRRPPLSLMILFWLTMISATTAALSLAAFIICWIVS